MYNYPGRILTVKHCIEMVSLNIHPIHLVLNHKGPKAGDFERSGFDDMLAINVIEAGQAEWASAVSVAPKKYRTPHFCVFCRTFNAVIVSTSYRFQSTDGCIRALEDAKGFSTLKANCGYWQISVDESVKEKTVPISCHRLCWFTRLVYGLRHSPPRFSLSRSSCCPPENGGLRSSTYKT